MMAGRRVGIELSGSRCALVDLELRAGALAPPSAEVRTFRAIPWSPDTAGPFVATLRLLRKSRLVPSRAVVALWGLNASYHHFSLPAGDDSRLRAQALRELRISGPAGVADDTLATVLVDGGKGVPGSYAITRGVTVVSAPAAEVRKGIAPLLEAEFEIDSVITPAMALASLARLLPTTDDDAARAYIAVNADATAVAVVQDGLLIHAREVALPFRAGSRGPDAGAEMRAADAVDFVRRLAPELKRSLLAVKPRDVRQVIICGDVPDLGALTAPLITALQVEVGTLDGFQGLPAAAGGHTTARDSGALRIAWAAGIAGSPAVSLTAERASVGRRSARAVMVRRAAAAVVFCATLVLAAHALLVRGASKPGAPAPARTPRAETTRPEPQPAAANAVGQPVPAAAKPAESRRQAQRAETSRARDAAVERAAADPVIDSILYGPDRRLALIGHRIVRVGDRVAGGVIADIEPKAVIVRRPSGELRRVELNTRR